MGHVQTSRLIPASIERVYEAISDLSRLNDWLNPYFAIDWMSENGFVRENESYELRLARFGIGFRIGVKVIEARPERCLTYKQTHGFFRSWVHTQKLDAHDATSTLLTDLVDFRAPMGFLGALVDDLWIRGDVARVLNHRLKIIEHHFEIRRQGVNDQSNDQGKNLA